MNAEDIKNFKMESCKKELKVLLKKLIENDYRLTAETIYNHVANSGVEMDLNPKLKNAKTLDGVLAEED